MKTKMTYIGKLGILFLMFASSVFSQNITTTLGTNGVFTIRDASTNFFTVSQSTGEVNILKSLRLENTTNSTLGVLFKGTNRFLHNYGIDNTFLGINSGNFTMTGATNTALGHSSLYSNTTGYYNTAVGNSSLQSNTTGYFNTALGTQSLYSNTTSFRNTGVGYASLFFNTTGYHNTAVGIAALYLNTTGYQSTAVGINSLYSNTTGHVNIAVGNLSLFSNTYGNSNIALGFQSLYSSTTGNYNTAVGNYSLSSNTAGNLNVAIGYSSGASITTGFNLICLGSNAEPSSNNAFGEITLGNSSNTSLRCNVQTITSLSDARDKKNIQDLSLGLDFLMKVKPRLFNWDKREWYGNNVSDGSKMKEEPTAGFIAQELNEVQTNENAEWLNLVLKNNPEKLEATYGNLLPVMVKAIQELKVENEKLKVVSLTERQENIDLKNDNKIMKQSLLKLEQTQNKLASELEKLKLKESKITEVDN